MSRDGLFLKKQISMPRPKEVAGGADVQVWVETYAGHGGVEMPQRFRLGGREIEVIENLDQWYGVQCHYFKVRGDDESVYILRFDAIRVVWELIMFQRPQNPSNSSELPYSGYPGRWSRTRMRLAEQG